jgi:hypothetical protein
MIDFEKEQKKKRISKKDRKIKNDEKSSWATKCYE